MSAWGPCKICHAKAGQPCIEVRRGPDKGKPLERDGRPLVHGARVFAGVKRVL